MAKRRKHSKRRRSRRVGAMKLGGKGGMLKLAAVAGGFLLASKINAQVDKILPKEAAPAGGTATTPTKSAQTMAMVGEIGLGGLLLMRKKSPGIAGTALQVAGGVLLGAGIKRALGVMGIISGFQSVPVIGRSHRMAGYQSVPVIGMTPPQLAGKIPPQLSGYTPAGSGVGAYVPAGSGVMGSIGCCDGGTGSGVNHNSSGYMN